jgi:hypothetical protein
MTQPSPMARLAGHQSTDRDATTPAQLLTQLMEKQGVSPTAKFVAEQGTATLRTDWQNALLAQTLNIPGAS